jgi:hypothetical protein
MPSSLDPKSFILDICRVNPHQLALTVGTLGVGIMNSTAFLLLANNNSKVDRNQISFGTVDFQLHPQTLTPIFASLEQEMDLTIGSLNFRVGSLGSIRLSDSTKSDLSVDVLDTGVSRSTCSWAPLMAQLRPRSKPKTKAQHRSPS